MCLRHELLNLKTDRIITNNLSIHNNVFLHSSSSLKKSVLKSEELKVCTEFNFFFFFLHLSIVAIYCLGSHGCYPYHHMVYCRLCCHSDGCHSCCSGVDDGGGGSLGRGRVADDGQSPAPPRSAGFCQCCYSGMRDADREYCHDVVSHHWQTFHLQTSAAAEVLRSRLTGPFASCESATSCCSSTNGGKIKSPLLHTAYILTYLLHNNRAS